LLAKISHLPKLRQFEVLAWIIAREPWREFTPDEVARSRSIVAKVEAAYNPIRWYHGGPPNLLVGAELLPANKTGFDPRGLAGEVEAHGKWVYITPSFDVALMYAKIYPGGGAVWHVTPQGEVSVDPVDLRATAIRGFEHFAVEAFCCARARIEKVEYRATPPSRPHSTSSLRARYA
jgi:hypothetical protein